MSEAKSGAGSSGFRCKRARIIETGIPLHPNRNEARFQPHPFDVAPAGCAYVSSFRFDQKPDAFIGNSACNSSDNRFSAMIFWRYPALASWSSIASSVRRIAWSNSSNLSLFFAVETRDVALEHVGAKT
jgi:hypothetical protein